MEASLIQRGEVPMNKLRAPLKIPSLLLMIVLILSCNFPFPTPEPTGAPPDTTPAAEELLTETPRPTPLPETLLPKFTKPVFAVYKEPSVSTVPSIYPEAVAPGLSNVNIPFALSPAQRSQLERDGFVVTPGTEKEFFTLYEQARYRNVPIFVTSDSLLHVYHLLFSKVLRTAEVEYFIPLLRDLNRAMAVNTQTNYEQLKSTPWEDAARRTAAFVCVAGRLLDPAFEVPLYARELVDSELANIQDAGGILPSPLFPGLSFGEDYTQYIPRGHYTRSDDLQAYFRAMMWYGRMTFRLRADDPEVGRAETRSALLLVHALRHATVAGRAGLDVWEDLYSPTVFFVGRSDDLTVHQYIAVIDDVYGEGISIKGLVDETKLDTFITLADQLPPPLILGIVIEDTADEDATTKGLRFMGQRFVPDAYIFRQLIYRNVGTRENPRSLPMGLDVFAAMGSDRAYQILEELDETRYQNYPAQMAYVRNWLSGLTTEDWTETLYNTWLYTFHPLLEVPGPGYPQFMQSTAWLDKQLNTTLGSWAELKHDTILYAKQVYAEMGGGPPPPPPVPPRGYVEPVPYFYARLIALTTMTREGLSNRSMLSDQDRESLVRLEELAHALQQMSEKQLRGEPLTEKEHSRIRFYGGELEHLTMAAADTGDGGPGSIGYMDDEPQAAVIADVATDPAGPDGPRVLEVGVGRIDEIHVIVPVVEDDGTFTLQVAKGGVFSYYEFPWPADDRLTDEAWRQMLDAGQAPPRPVWTSSFSAADGEYAELQTAIFYTQKSLTSAYWEQRTTFRDDEPALQPFAAEIERLTAANRYMGHQLVATHFRSFDLQGPNLAVVTVRETWQDTLHSYTGSWPDYIEPAIAERGPYTLDVTYSLQLETTTYGAYWNITHAVYANDPPPW
jgi:hypothetical protein